MENTLSDVRVINTKLRDLKTEDTPIPGIKLAENLRKSLLRLKGRFISEDGKSVNYLQMKESPEFRAYLTDANDLCRVDLSHMSEVERKVFFLNIYNSLTIHGLLEQPALPDSVLSVRQFFKTTAYNIGGHVYSLDDIEHGILRCNNSHPASITPQFPPDDPRLKFICHTLDPRIHFALVCGAKSCPAISVYSVENIDSALDKATRNFCGQEVEIKARGDEIAISKLFQWYRSDFGKDDIDVLKWIQNYLGPSEQDKFSIIVLKLEMMGHVNISYRDYNWTINK
ncbi:uncharacterized protein LOC131958563 [Physella acuta]|uniref:uncharacterized protein LOC131958563 n=1 Tax=Physella acuta TaxID=109671 RepID=UPI0027DBC7AB|nr:uncharacterized protein LOC131958563 [Physella acuta]